MNDENLETDLTNPEALSPDDVFELTLRPRSLVDYIGQPHIKENLLIFMEAAKQRQEPIEHLLLYGPPGLGKTTLAYIIANEMGVSVKITSGPAIQRSGDLVAILSNLQEGDVLFIDEIHRLMRNVEEVLYSAMEDYAIDLILGKGPSAKSMRLSLPKFTLVGATTKFGSLSSPLRDRFGAVHRLEFYSVEDLAKIIKRAAKILKIKEIDDQSITEIAKRSRRTPRIANRILRRVRDWAEVKNSGIINLSIARDAIDNLHIDSLGLDRNDRDYLRLIAEKFAGGPVGLETISAALSEDKDTVEDVTEPYLLQLGFISRTNRGRVLSELGYSHLGINSQQGQAPLL
ncbi:MAG: Holliday junction branch migration DNA helicase RuvB [Candidatus Berkelbacteria bacterium]